MTTITEEKEIIIGLAVRIRIGFREGMNNETCDHVVYMFQPIDRSHHHLVHQGFLIDFDAANVVGHTYDNQYIQELYLQLKDHLHDDITEKRFERGYITNKRLFIGRRPAFVIARDANQLYNNHMSRKLQDTPLYSDMLSPSKAELDRQYKVWMRKVMSFGDFNMVIMSPTHELIQILGLHYHEITDHTEDEKYKTLVTNLIK